MHSWKCWYFQHIRLNIFGIHLKKVNILYIFPSDHIFVSKMKQNDSLDTRSTEETVVKLI